MTKIKSIPVPEDCHIGDKPISLFYSDSFAFTVTGELTAKQVYHAIFGYLPKPVQWAMKVRNAVVGVFGFSAGDSKMSLPIEEIQPGKQAGFLVFEKVADEEVVAAAYESNMDMWLSVMKQDDHTVAMSTLVNLKTKRGCLYMAMIKPFHKLVAKYSIASAISKGRI